MKRYILIFVAVMAGAFGIGAGIALLSNIDALSRHPSGTQQTAITLPDFRFEDIDGNQRASGEWNDKVRVVNFWATWCPPCRAEIPGFVDLQDKYGSRNVQFVGIAVDDKALVAEFAQDAAINYPVLIGDLNAVELSKQLGNRFGGLPFTVVVDREGAIRHRQPGEMKQDELETILTGLL